MRKMQRNICVLLQNVKENRVKYEHYLSTTLGRTTLGERSARRRDLYQTTHYTHNRQTSMPPAGFETVIPASEGRRATP